MFIGPCKDCKDRHLGCHSTCSKYLEAKEASYKINDARIKYIKSKDKITAPQRRKTNTTLKCHKK